MAQPLEFQYQVAAAGTITDANTPATGWTDYNTLDFVSPTPGTSTATALVGNDPANRTALSSSLVVSVNPGQEIWLRWLDINDAGNDHGLGIDDFSVTPQGVVVDVPPSVVSTVPTAGATGVAITSNITVTFSEAVTAGASSFTLECPFGTPIAFGVSGGGTTYTIDPTSDLLSSTTCTATVIGANVTDLDGTADPMASNYPWTFTTASSVPTLTLNDVTQNEGNSGTTTFTFSVSLSAASASAVTFDIATADNTATLADDDYIDHSLTGQSIPAGNTTYTFDVTVNGDTTFEPNETFFVNATNVTGANVADGQGLGTITNDDVQVAEIFEIQGSGATSPYATQVVSTHDNIVTAVGPQGFFIQTPTARADADPNTSNGIYVFTSTAPTVVVGDIVDVTGTVVEYFTFTEFSPVTSVTVDSSGNPLPDAIELDETFPPTDPASTWWAIGFERLEGMRVHVANGITSGPNQRRASDLSAEIYGVANLNRPFRGAGIQYPGLPALPIWDGNPEVFEIDPDFLGAVPDPDYVPAGSTYSATGVMGFDFGNWELWPTAFTFTPPASLPRPVRVRNGGEFTVGTYNLLQLDATAGDYAARLQKHSAYIRTVLGAPDVLGVQECMSITELNALAARIHTDDSSLTYTAYLEEGHDVGGIDVGFLVRDTVTNVDVSQLGYDVKFSLEPTKALHDRPPLLLEGSYVGNGAPFAFTVMVNHTRSLIGIDDDPPLPATGDGPRVRQKRLEQAQWIAQWMQDYQTAPANRSGHS